MASKTLANFAKVAKIIAVSSCKGGVGKSTVSLNLAHTLNNFGHNVGILDCDVFGPSLPTMVSPEMPVRYPDDGDTTILLPGEENGLKLMSFGFLGTAGGNAAIMRGPMVSSVINSLLTMTEWNELDYLVLDLPPGTGDVHLSVAQQLEIDGAVIVTTPQLLSFVDVVKGIEMFDKLEIPSVAVVENMSYFECEHGTKYHPFGTGHVPQLQAQFGIANSVRIPLDQNLSVTTDKGRCLALSDPDSPIGLLYQDLARGVIEELEKVRSSVPPLVKFVEGRGVVLQIFSEDSAEEVVLDPAELRRGCVNRVGEAHGGLGRCQCALCIDEFTGEQILKPEDVPDDVKPTKIETRGNYAVSVSWDDGHSSSLYPYKVLMKLVDEQRK